MLLYVCCCRCWLTFPCGRSYIYRSLCSGDTSLVWREVAAHTVSRVKKNPEIAERRERFSFSGQRQRVSFLSQRARAHISYVSALDPGRWRAEGCPPSPHHICAMGHASPTAGLSHESPNLRTQGCNGQRHLLPLTLFKLVRLNYPPSERQASSFDSL